MQENKLAYGTGTLKNILLEFLIDNRLIGMKIR